MSRIVIRHLSGSKVNQVEIFPLETTGELTLGRDPASAIAFGGGSDDLVSRRHARITVQHEPELRFQLADLGSSNGTFVNEAAIAREVELMPGDTVQLGSGGPSFVFDVEPRPAHLLPRTRQQGIPSTASPATRIAGSAEKSVVGRQTLQRELAQVASDRRQTSRRWSYAAAALILLVGGAGAYLFQQQRSEAAKRAEVEAQAAQVAAKVDSQDLTRRQVAERYAGSTVLVEASWRLYDKATGNAVYQRCLTDGGVCHPLFVSMPDGNVARWLTIEDENQSNLAIAETGHGSGFVVTPNGFILTNKHVAAGWLMEFDPSQVMSYADEPFVVDYGGRKEKARPASASERAAMLKLQGWVPSDGAPLFRKDVAAGDPGSAFEGRLDRLSVRFPGTTNSVAASLIRTSGEADVALIKIDVPQQLTPVMLAPSDQPLALGEAVTVIGYPNITPATINVQETIQKGDVRTITEAVPQPTIAEGIIANVGAKITPDAEKGTRLSELGDMFQLSTQAIGPGSSGGPVFDSRGQVIGLMTMMGNRAAFAVPIRYGNDLLKVSS